MFLEDWLNVPDGALSTLFDLQSWGFAHLYWACCLLAGHLGDPSLVLQSDLFLEELSIYLVQFISFLLPSSCLYVEAAFEVLHIFLVPLLFPWLFSWLWLLGLVGLELRQDSFCEFVIGSFLFAISHVQRSPQWQKVFWYLIWVFVVWRSFIIYFDEFLAMTPWVNVNCFG